VPTLFKDWAQPDVAPTWQDIAALYESGYSGIVLDEKKRAEERERFYGELPNPDGEEVCTKFGFADSSAGQLVATWVAVEQTYPGCWPASAQQRGDCVSHSQRNAELTTLVGEVVAGLPDAVSGKTEEAPQVSPEAQRDGVLATEAKYRHRGSRGDGWFCLAAARVAVQTTGAVVRKDYPGIANLTRYNPSWAGGSAGASERDVFDDNKFREATEPKTFEAIRDLLSRGFGVSSCGSEGFAKTRDENGVSRRSGSWAHAMAVVGADDRSDTHRLYGGPLLLILNSWGPRWNDGPRKVRGTEIEIPQGSFWAKWSDLSRRSFCAMAGLNGWQRRSLPDYLGGW
jgi:hypothetical protein